MHVTLEIGEEKQIEDEKRKEDAVNTLYQGPPIFGKHNGLQMAALCVIKNNSCKTVGLSSFIFASVYCLAAGFVRKIML